MLAMFAAKNVAKTAPGLLPLLLQSVYAFGVMLANKQAKGDETTGKLCRSPTLALEAVMLYRA